MAPSPPLSMSHPDYYLTAAPEDVAAEDVVETAEPTEASPTRPPLVEKPEKKRRRPALSCEQCRRRKIRCDRGLPCANCVRSKISPCTYAPTHIPASRGKKPGGHGAGAESGADRPVHMPIRSGPAPPSEHLHAAHSSPSLTSTAGSTSETSSVEALVNRIKQLEQKLANNVHISSPVDRLETCEEDPSAPMRGTVNKTRFFGQSHFMNGADLVSMPYLTTSHHCTYPSVKFPSILTILGQAEISKIEPYSTFVKCKTLGRSIKEHRLQPLTTNRLGLTIPTRGLADQLVDIYFDTFEGAIRILHAPTFRAEYERYWQNPSAASDVFVMQLQLVMAIGATMHDDLFALRTMAMNWVHECQIWLLLPPEKSRMTIAGIQIMCMLTIAKATCAVGQDLTWVSTGALVRQAMYMGLHRDPKHLADMSVYRAEIRRRLWATILELNLQSSYDAGGPPLISPKHYDTQAPANLNDEQLSDEPDGSRAPVNVNELTDMSVPLVLMSSQPLRLAIIKHVNEFRSNDSYPETLRLNSDLTKACRTITETLSALSKSQTRCQRTIFNHFHGSLVQILLYRCFISLHMPMLSKSAHDPTFYYSRKVSLDCSLKLAHICGIATNTYTPTQPGPPEPSVAFVRLVTNGAGLFRVIPVQTLFSISLELIKKNEEKRDGLGIHPSSTCELRGVLESCLMWTARRLRSGETNVKGHCFIAAGLALCDAIAQGLPQDEIDQLVINEGAASSFKCWGILKEVAEREGVPVGGEEELLVNMEGVESIENMMEMPFDWMGDYGWEAMGGLPWTRGAGATRQFDELNNAGIVPPF
ncbi:hypothetical protein G7046_g7820 [Stylonectria norvegica]|nr:hypothetical protein G7046_g7820 [Stylonectria norvegica]